MLLLSPFAPHLAEEIWDRVGLGERESALVAEQAWPAWDEEMLKVDQVEIVIQILGRNRARMMIDPRTPEDEIQSRALAEERIATLLEGKEIKNIFYVKGKLVNIVAK